MLNLNRINSFTKYMNKYPSNILSKKQTVNNNITIFCMNLLNLFKIIGTYNILISNNNIYIIVIIN